MPLLPVDKTSVMGSVRQAAVLVAMLALACDHQASFPSGDVPDAGPWAPAPPVRLTFSTRVDREPAWLVDGSGIAYSFQQGDSATDLCLGALPAAGGTRWVDKCVRVAADTDSVEALREVAAGPGGRFAWRDSRSKIRRIAPDVGSIRLGTLARTDTGTAIHPIPYLAPSGNLHLAITHLRWLTPTTLTYVGAMAFYGLTCGRCQDTTLTGLEVALLDLAASPAAVSIVPNTYPASSVWPAADGASIYYTLGGDSVVYQQWLASGAVTMVHDFGSRGIVRDVSVRGARMVAVVGGQVIFTNDPELGPVQRDRGGDLVMVDLASGNETEVLLPEMLVRRPALSPDGRRVVVEMIPARARPIPDLWLLELP